MAIVEATPIQPACLGLLTGVALLLLVPMLLISRSAGSSDSVIMTSRRLRAPNLALPTTSMMWVFPQATTLSASSSSSSMSVQVSTLPPPVHVQLRNGVSSGSLGSLASSASSSWSSDSLESSASGSLQYHNFAKVSAFYTPIVGGFAWVVNLLLIFAYAFIYKQKVVDKVGYLEDVNIAGHAHLDFGLCDFCTFRDYCLMACFCPFVRLAHTNEMSHTCDYWWSLIWMGVCLLCPAGPCCLNMYFRFHFKEQLGVEDHLDDMLLAFYCFPCTIGQQALSLDHHIGYEVSCCCEAAHWGGTGGDQMKAHDMAATARENAALLRSMSYS